MEENRKLVVLIVEDDPDLQKTMTEHLERLAYDVVGALHYDAAIDELATRRPDLVCVNVGLPTQSGYELCEYIRGPLRLAHVPILLTNDSGLPEDMANAEEAGASAFLKKPFSMQELVGCVEALLRSSALVATLVLLLALFSGCSSGGKYVWVNELPPQQAGDEFVIAQGDLIGVRVFNQDSMSTHARVRSDGKIAVPFLGDVDVRGKQPSVLSKELEERFKQYMVSPVVTVTVDETQPTTVSVLGEVTKPGVYTVDASSGVLQALASAGGFTEYASRDSIYVVRRSPALRVRFTYASLAQNDDSALKFRLHAGDVLLVE